MQVCLIESTTPDELVSQVKKQPRKSPAEVVSESESSKSTQYTAIDPSN